MRALPNAPFSFWWAAMHRYVDQHIKDRNRHDLGSAPIGRPATPVVQERRRRNGRVSPSRKAFAGRARAVTSAMNFRPPICPRGAQRSVDDPGKRSSRVRSAMRRLQFVLLALIRAVGGPSETNQLICFTYMDGKCKKNTQHNVRAKHMRTKATTGENGKVRPTTRTAMNPMRRADRASRTSRTHTER